MSPTVGEVGGVDKSIHISYPPDRQETRDRQTVRGGSPDLDITIVYVVHCIFPLGWIVPVSLQVIEYSSINPGSNVFVNSLILNVYFLIINIEEDMSV